MGTEKPLKNCFLTLGSTGACKHHHIFLKKSFSDREAFVQKVVKKRPLLRYLPVLEKDDLYRFENS